MTDEVRHLRVEVQVLERAVHRFEERLAGLRDEMIRGFDRMDILLSNQFGEILTLFGQANTRIDTLTTSLNDIATRLEDGERRTDERHAEILAAIKGMQG